MPKIFKELTRAFKYSFLRIGSTFNRFLIVYLNEYLLHLLQSFHVSHFFFKSVFFTSQFGFTVIGNYHKIQVL